MEKTKDSIRAEVDALVMEYNEKYQGGSFSEAIDLDSKIQDLVGEYTGMARDECFGELMKSDDPMKAAVIKLTFPTIRCVDKKVGDDKIPVREVVMIDKPIDIMRLHRAAGGIGQNKDWHYMIEKFNFLLTARTALDIGIDPKGLSDSYAMSQISKKLDMGETPTSNTQVLKAMQSVVTAMVGEEYKCTSHDVGYLMKIYSKKGKGALKVSCANHKYLRQYMAEICHKIIMKKGYDLDYKKAKKN